MQVSYKKISKHKSARTIKNIDRITPHCVVGQFSAQQICDYFASTDRKASSNYVIGANGDIGISVEEKDRSWCSSNIYNDNRAITIECASNRTHPYSMTKEVYQSLIDLCVDICNRYNRKKLIWIGDKKRALSYKPSEDEMLLTVHRWFARKACPGDWLYSRLPDLAEKVTARLRKKKSSETYSVKAPEGLTIRSGPGMNFNEVGEIKTKGLYTIVDDRNGWGKLKSGAGWILLEFTKKV